MHTVVPDASDGRNFRLIRDGRVIPAQFRKVDGSEGRRDVALDFIASPGPLETSRYEVQFGPSVEPGPEADGGLTIEQRDGVYLISHGRSLTFAIPENLAGFLQSVGSPGLQYLRSKSGGLSIREKAASSATSLESKKPDRSRMSLRLTRHGPFAVGLRSEWTSASGLLSRLDLTIPSSKSWLQADWKIDDPNGLVSGLDMDLHLRMEGLPTLVDFGAGSTVYGEIKGKERMEFLSGSPKDRVGQGSGLPWLIRRGVGNDLQIVASSTLQSPRPAEGWAHVMDTRGCSALAISEFGREGSVDTIAVDADGRLQLTRDYSVGKVGGKGSTRGLEFWLHFVPMPVQVGAATSPQSVLSPLVLEWDRTSA